jgi:PAS domain S-box-containing protein
MVYEQYKKAIERSNIVSRTDIHGIITFVNDEFCRISGYSREELIGRDHNIVRHPDVPAETFERLWAAILTKKTYHSTVKNLAKDGSTFYVNTTITPILDKEGEIEEFIAIRYDVTKEVQLQLQLQEKQEMLLWQSRFASLGQMMANIAHQWRQPLTELNLLLYTLKKAALSGDNEEVETIHADTQRVIHSMSQTIDDFQNFFKPGKEKEPFDPRNSIDNALALLKKALRKEAINLTLTTDKGITLLGIQNELTQVLVNLIQNAKDALVAQEIDDPHITIMLSQKDTHAIITVEDNAGGVPEALKGKIFEPYFTTKHARQGTGLGLFMSKLIVEKSLDGSLSVHDTDQGASFRIAIPLTEESPEP